VLGTTELGDADRRDIRSVPGEGGVVTRSRPDPSNVHTPVMSGLATASPRVSGRRTPGSAYRPVRRAVL